MTSIGFGQRLADSLERVVRWVQHNRYRGYEPADGNSSILFSLTGGRVLPMRLLQQVVLRAPFNLRPLIGISPHESAIGRGYMAWGYVLISQLAAQRSMCQEARRCFDWLIANRARGYDEYCWGDPYDYATRSGRRPYGEPLLIWSALIGQAFLAAFEVFRDDRYLSIADSIGAWVLKLPRDDTALGCCLSYVTYNQASIHNANAMGAAFLARLGALTENQDTLALAHKAMTYTCARQRLDGSWLYAEDPKYHWVDSFHTGYILSALRVYMEASRDNTYGPQLALGAAYFKANFFEADGRPKYFDNTTYPIDIQCAAQAIETLTTVSADDSDALDLASKVADWTIANMQDKDGHFYYRDLGWTKVKTPMLHWGQGTMVKALATLLNRIDSSHA